MWRLIKFLLYLLILGAVVFIGYAYIGPIVTPEDFVAPSEEVSEPVTLDLE
ncbi:hypothetical protein AADZ90_007975 [Aestuariibius sp. 2305UL40-4]|uniref:hypothetical protein n=1 Tax=Aestuariibius violaceus TaxID=3234132 RepID=UPI00345F1512